MTRDLTQILEVRDIPQLSSDQLRRITEDPDFLRLPFENKVALLQAASPDFRNLRPHERMAFVRELTEVSFWESLGRGARIGTAQALRELEGTLKRVAIPKGWEERPTGWEWIAQRVAPPEIPPEREHQVGRMVGELGAGIITTLGQLAVAKKVPLPVKVTKYPKVSRAIETAKTFGTRELIFGEKEKALGEAASGLVLGVIGMPASRVYRFLGGAVVGAAAAREEDPQEIAQSAAVMAIFNALGKRYGVSREKLVDETVREAARAIAKREAITLEEALNRALKKATGKTFPLGTIQRDVGVLAETTSKLEELGRVSRGFYRPNRIIPTQREVALTRAGLSPEKLKAKVYILPSREELIEGKISTVPKEPLPTIYKPGIYPTVTREEARRRILGEPPRISVKEAREMLGVKPPRIPVKKAREMLGVTLPEEQQITLMHSGFPIGALPREIHHLAKDVKNFTGERVREGLKFVEFPFWTQFKGVVKKLLYVEDVGNRHSYVAHRIAKPYFNLEDKSKVNSVLLEGDASRYIFSLKELKELGLSPEEIGAYQSVLRANNYLFKSATREMLKEVGLKNEKITEIIKEADIEGYIPHYRFGRWGVVAKDAKGKVIHLEGDQWAESGAQRLAQDLASSGKFPADTSYSIIPLFTENKYMDYISPLLTSRSLAKALFKDDKRMVGVIEKVFQEVEQRALKRAVGGRLARRLDIPGYSTDVERALRTYYASFPHSMARKVFRGVVEEEKLKLGSIDQDYARKLIDYAYGARNHEGKLNLGIRQAIYFMYLGGKPSFGIVNVSQRVQTTLWKAVAESDLERGGKAFLEAQAKELSLLGDIIKKRIHMGDAIKQAKYLSQREKHVLTRMVKEGEVEPLLQEEITGLKESTFWKYANLFGAASERSNRIQSALTALQLRPGGGYKEQYDYVKDFVWKTQFPYRKAARPQIGRGIGAIPFVFKTFIGNKLHFLADLYKQDKKACVGAIATNLLLHGTSGIIGGRLAMECVDGVMREIDPQWELTKQEIKDQIPRIVTDGLPALAGISGSRTFGDADVLGIAGYNLFIKLWQASTGEIWEPVDVPQVVIEKMVKKGLIPSDEAITRQAEAFADKADVQIMTLIGRISPTIISHLINLQIMNQRGMPPDLRGKERLTVEDINRMPVEMRARAFKLFEAMPKEMPEHEKWFYALGFSTPALSRYYEIINAIKTTSRTIKEQKAGAHEEIGRGVQR